MQHGEAAELLARVPVLRGIGGEFLSVIMQIGEPVRFTAHDTLAVAGMPADAALVILEGEVTLYNENGREFGEPLGPGQTVNEMAMIVETSHHFSAFGANDGFALRIGSEAFGRLMGQYPWLAAHLARNIGQDLKATAQTLHELDDMLVISEHELMPFVGEEAADESSEDVDDVSDVEDEEFELANTLGDLAVGEHSPFVQRIVRGHDLLADLSEAISPSDQTMPEPAHDLTASPSPALRRSL